MTDQSANYKAAASSQSPTNYPYTLITPILTPTPYPHPTYTSTYIFAAPTPVPHLEPSVSSAVLSGSYAIRYTYVGNDGIHHASGDRSPTSDNLQRRTYMDEAQSKPAQGPTDRSCPGMIDDDPNHGEGDN